MNNDGHFRRELMAGIKEGAIGGFRSTFDDSAINGFNAAANICMVILTETIDGLVDKVKSGADLSDREKGLLAGLSEIKSATERELDDFDLNQLWSR